MPALIGSPPPSRSPFKLAHRIARAKILALAEGKDFNARVQLFRIDLFVVCMLAHSPPAHSLLVFLAPSPGPFVVHSLTWPIRCPTGPFVGPVVSGSRAEVRARHKWRAR
eukprot:6548974-Pyramimonas_sp.AAC.1